MSTLRNPLRFLDVIMDKKMPEKMYMILKETVHNVWVIDMEGQKEPFELPKAHINRVFIKVDPKSVKVLFAERSDENINNDSQFEPTATSAE